MFYRLPLSPDQSSKNVGLHTNITLLQLKPYTLYEVRVQAFTGAGGGDLSRVNVLTDETSKSQGYGTVKFYSLFTRVRFRSLGLQNEDVCLTR